MRPWVVDTSPLIFLSKLGRLDLLRRSAAEVLIPEAVLREIREESDESTSQVERRWNPGCRFDLSRISKSSRFFVPIWTKARRR
jgi:hypothetical protein